MQLLGSSCDEDQGYAFPDIRVMPSQPGLTQEQRDEKMKNLREVIVIILNETSTTLVKLKQEMDTYINQQHSVRQTVQVARRVKIIEKVL